MSVVPVLPAAGSVKPSARAFDAVPRRITSDSMLDIKNAVSGLTARAVVTRVCQRTVPDPSVTRRMKTGSARMPWLANAEYADVSSSSVNSPVPSASDGTAGSADVMPRRLAASIVASTPTVCINWAAARLLETVSARRSV